MKVIRGGRLIVFKIMQATFISTVRCATRSEIEHCTKDGNHSVLDWIQNGILCKIQHGKRAFHKADTRRLTTDSCRPIVAKSNGPCQRLP
jgi:hypothetical protein